MKQTVLVLGLGEIGKPIYDLIASQHNVFGIDPKKKNVSNFDIDFENPGKINVMHVCYPFANAEHFEKITVAYVNKYAPKLTIIESTVALGTTEHIRKATGAIIVHSPIRGVHKRMRRDLLRYTKFIGAPHIDYAMLAKQHFESIGLKTKICSSAKATELMKLLSTTYYGLLIAWAQETNRICKKQECNYDEMMSFSEEINQFVGGRPSFYPGFIGGHCVIQNTELLKKQVSSDFINAILKSNVLKKQELENE